MTDFCERCGRHPVECGHEPDPAMVDTAPPDRFHTDPIDLGRGYLRKVAASQGIASVQSAKPGKRSGGYTEMRSTDPALVWMPVRRSRRAWLEDGWVPVAGGRPMPDDDEDNERWRRFPAAAAQRREERRAWIAAPTRSARAQTHKVDSQG